MSDVGIAPYFNEIIGLGDDKRKYDAQFSKITNKYNPIKFYLGDSIEDIDLSQKHNIEFVGVTNQFRSNEYFTDKGINPRNIIRDIYDLEEIL